MAAASTPRLVPSLLTISIQSFNPGAIPVLFSSATASEEIARNTIIVSRRNKLILIGFTSTPPIEHSIIRDLGLCRRTPRLRGAEQQAPRRCCASPGAGCWAAEWDRPGHGRCQQPEGLRHPSGLLRRLSAVCVSSKSGPPHLSSQPHLCPFQAEAVTGTAEPVQLDFDSGTSQSLNPPFYGRHVDDPIVLTDHDEGRRILARILGRPV